MAYPEWIPQKNSNLRKKLLCLHCFGPLWTISTGDQWEIRKVGCLSFFIDLFVWFHISLFPTPFDQCHFHPTLGLDPALKLTLRLNLKWWNWSDNSSPYWKTCFSSSEWFWHAKNYLVKFPHFPGFLLLRMYCTTIFPGATGPQIRSKILPDKECLFFFLKKYKSN